MNFENFDPVIMTAVIIVMIFGVGLHEFGHAKFADLAGDPTPRSQGRVTLNPFAHLDPLGSLMFILSSLTGVGIGWGKPVMVRPQLMRNPRWDHFISVIAGPTMNLLQAVCYAILYRLLINNPHTVFAVLNREDHSMLHLIIVFGVLMNVGMMVFNLIPIGPLDGHWLVGAFMPDKARIAWYQFNRGPGMIIFLILVIIPNSPIVTVISPIIVNLARFFFGIK